MCDPHDGQDPQLLLETWPNDLLGPRVSEVEYVTHLAMAAAMASFILAEGHAVGAILGNLMHNDVIFDALAIQIPKLQQRFHRYIST